MRRNRIFTLPIYLAFALIVLFLVVLPVPRKKGKINQTLWGWAFDAALCLLFAPPVLSVNVSWMPGADC